MINTDALRHNFQQIKTLAPHSKILAMVKANAYGHGLLKIAKALPDADGFGVACLSEAVKLRKAGITQKIVVMRGVFTPEELNLADTLKLDLVIHSPEQLTLLSKQTHWLKINTGMNRLGFMPAEIPDIYQQLKQRDIILMSHLASAEIADDPRNLQQIQCFEDITRDMPHPKSLANSAAILNFKQSHADWVRPGLMLYGVSSGLSADLQPVMTFQAPLIAVRMQKKGDLIGYNGIYCCAENMPVGIIGAGYGDGYPRHAQTGTPILMNNIEVPLIGRVSMDMLTVDLRKAPSAKIGDTAFLWGEKLPVEKIAAYTAASPYDLLCGVKLRAGSLSA